MAYKKLKLWFDGELADLLSEKINAIPHLFEAAKYRQAVEARVDPLELKDRVELMADLLGEQLGLGYKGNVEVLLQIMGPENPKETEMFTEYYWLMPVAKYVEKYGLEHFELSMRAIEEITKRNTGEFTIRPYLQAYPEQTLVQMKEWSKHESRHVRRLATEGVRPRLPWASKLQAFIDDPTPIIPILETLKDDPSKYVRTSVANNLNDIMKDNFQIGKDIIDEWKVNPSKERAWIIKHAIRNYRKKQIPWALEMTRELSGK